MAPCAASATACVFGVPAGYVPVSAPINPAVAGGDPNFSNTNNVYVPLKNGALIPWSFWYQRPLALEDYLAAPMVAEPICRYDADIPVDGVACFLFTSAERARDLPHPPVYVGGFASGAPVTRRLQQRKR